MEVMTAVAVTMGLPWQPMPAGYLVADAHPTQPLGFAASMFSHHHSCWGNFRYIMILLLGTTIAQGENKLKRRVKKKQNDAYGHTCQLVDLER